MSRRSVSYAVIAQTPGDITLAGVRLPWWNVVDAALGGCGAAAARAARERRPPTPPLPRPQPPSRCRRRAAGRGSATRSYWPWVSGVLGAAWLATRRALVAFADARAAQRRRRERGAASPTRSRRCARSCATCAARAPSATRPRARNALLAYAETRFAPSSAAQPRRIGGAAAGAVGARGARARGAHLRRRGRRLARRRARGAARRPRERGGGPGAGRRRAVAAALSIRTNRVCDLDWRFRAGPFGACFRIRQCLPAFGMDVQRLDPDNYGSPYAEQLKRGFRGLRFDGLLEKDFREFYVAQNLPRARLSGLIALILVLAVTCIDLLLGASTGGTLEHAAPRHPVPAARRPRRRDLGARRAALLHGGRRRRRHADRLRRDVHRASRRALRLLVRAGRPRARRAVRLLCSSACCSTSP